MGLLPIIGKALGLFSFLIISALTISYILYKMRSLKNKSNKRTSINPYQANVSYAPAFQAAYYPAAEMVPERADVQERRNISERADYYERSGSGMRNHSDMRNHSERKQLQEKKARLQNKFQILQSTEEGEIKAYHLPTGSQKFY